MTIKVEPDNPYSTHQVKLTHRGVSLGLITCDYRGDPAVSKIDIDPIPSSAMKTYSGMQQYADMVPPWTPVAQSDFSGGSGAEDFDLDRMRYYDGMRIDSLLPGKLISGPGAHYASGIRNQEMYWPRHDVNGAGLEFIPAGLIGKRSWYATAFTASATYEPTSINLMCGWYTADSSYKPILNVFVYDNDSGKPKNQLGSGTISAAGLEPNVIKERVIPITMSSSLVSGNTYHVVVQFDYSQMTYWNFIYIVDWPGAHYSSDGTNWTAGSQKIIYRLAGAEKTMRSFFGELKGSFYAGLAYDDGTVSKVFMNGEQGIATGGNGSSLVDSTKNWANDVWKGAIVVFRAGPGSRADENYRVITWNSGNTLYFAAADIAPGALTEYSIVGTDRWSEVGSNPMTGVITDQLDTNDMLYYAMGGDEVIRRLRVYNSAGTWTRQWADETGKARLLCDGSDNDGAVIWKANENAQIAKAPAINGAGSGAAAALTFGTAITVGDLADRINGMTIYGDNGYLNVLKESGLYVVVGDKPYRTPVYGMESTKDRRNGVAHAAMGQYLYMGWHDQIMRYYVNDFKNLFPEGLPKGRYSKAAEMVAYADRLYIAKDAGKDGFSSILAYNGLGMCEVYRAPAAGLRIRGLKIQSIPGNAVDRLWFSCGSDIVWLPMVYDATKHPYMPYQFYDFNYESHLVTAWHYLGMRDLYKLFYSLKVISENVRFTRIMVDYQVDEKTEDLESSWVNIGHFYGDVIVKRELSSAYDVVGRRIRFRLRLNSGVNTETAKVIGYVLETMMKTQVINTYQVTFRVEDRGVNSQGQPEEYGTVEYITGLLKEWSASPYPANVRSVVSELDNKWVMIEPATVRILDVIEEEERQVYICNMRLVEVGSYSEYDKVIIG